MMLHVISGLILLILVVCNPDLVRRALGVPSRRRSPRKVSCEPLPPSVPGAGGVHPESRSKAVAPIAPTPQGTFYKTPFVCSFEPFRPERKNQNWVEKKQQEEWEEFGHEVTSDTYPHGYGLERDADGNLTFRFKEKFRSVTEVEWAKTFDRLGLQWEYEPLKFDMGPEHFSYTPDFRVAGLSIPDSNRALYIETKWFGEAMDLTKYVRFTEWYNCDLLILAQDKGGVLRPEKQRYFLILKCAHCGTYDWFPYNEVPTDDCLRLVERRPVRPPGGYTDIEERFPFGYRLEADGTFWLMTGEPSPSSVANLGLSENVHPAAREAAIAGLADRMPFRHHPSVCQETPLERIIVPNYFLIQAGTIGKGRVVLPDGTSDARHISYTCT